MKKLLVLLLVLLLNAPVWGTDFFVRDDGDDAGCDGTKNLSLAEKDGATGCAEKSIAAAIADCGTSGDTVKVAPGTYSSTTYINAADANGKTVSVVKNGDGAATFSTTSNLVYARAATGSVAFSGLTFVQAATASANTAVYSEGAGTVSFDSTCSVDNSAGVGSGILVMTGAATVTFNGTSLVLTSTRDSSHYAIDARSGTLNLIGCTINPGAGVAVKQSVGGVTNITGGTITTGDATGIRASAGKVVCTGVTLDNSAATNARLTVDNQGGYVELNGCTVTTGHGHGLNWSAAAASGVTYLLNGTFGGNNFDDGYGLAYISDDTSVSGKCIIRGTHFTSNKKGLWFRRGMQKVEVVGAVVDINAEATKAGQGIACGVDSTDGTGPSKHIQHARIVGNTVSFSGADSSHGILIGEGVDRYEVLTNKVLSSDCPLVIKSDGGIAENNRLSTGNHPEVTIRNGIWLRDASNVTIAHNSVYVHASDGGNAGIVLDHHSTSPEVYCTKNLIHDNLIYASAFVYSEENAGTPTDEFNVYHHNIGYAANWCRVNGTTYALPALAANAWMAAFKAGTCDNPYNDISSVLSNPKFIGVGPLDTNFLEIPFSSPAKGAAGDVYGDVGAFQRKEKAQQPPIER